MKITYLTATRSEYGLMREVLKELRQKVELKLVVTGMHLMQEFGHSQRLIAADGFDYLVMDVKVKADGREDQLKYFSELVIKFTGLLQNKPDYVMVVGDRIEALAAAVCCTYLKIPLCHLHGGERSSTVDDAVRHSISKLAHIHFPATEQSRHRLLKMGEEDWRIKVIGSPGAYYAQSRKLLTAEEIFSKLELGPVQDLFLIVLHPEDDSKSEEQAKAVFHAASKIKGKIVVIYPNTDPGHSKIIKEIKKYNFAVFANLEYDMFLSILKNCTVMMGNSSSGIIEAPSLGTPVVNIGKRQLDRERASNIIDVGFDEKDILKSINKAISMKRVFKNPYYGGDPSKNIINYLFNANPEKLLQKRLTY